MKRPSAAAGGMSVESNGSAGPTLMDRWKEHYNQRDFTTKPHHLQRMGLFAYFYCLLGAPTICALFIVPSMDLTWSQCTGLAIAILFLLLENALNFRACIRLHHDKDIVFCFHCSRLNPLLKSAHGANGPRIGWRACPKCQQDAPPRSHHCKQCAECVLRRDHHCYFLCCCIGHHNQKHFVVLCLYTIVGLALLNYLVAAGLTDQFASPWRVLLPVTAWHWLTGHCGIGSFVLLFSLYLQLGCFAMACVYLSFETVLILRGQTFYEGSHGIHRYNLGVLGNLRSTLGSCWYHWPMLIVYPFDVKQSMDGVNWPVTKQL